MIKDEKKSLFEEFEEIKEKAGKKNNDKVRMAFFGQPGAGKSTLINSIVGEKKANTGVETDVTQEAQIIKYNEMLLVDLPGYGTSKFPENEYFKEFNPLQYDLFICVFSGKFHQADTNFFNEIKQQGRMCIFVRTKSDEIWDADKDLNELKNEISRDVCKQICENTATVYFVSSKTKEGIKELKDVIYDVLEPAKKDKFIRSVKAESMDQLDKKKNACDEIIAYRAYASAANAINPIPGVDVGVDLGIMMEMFSEIRNTFGLNDSKLNEMKLLLPIANKVLSMATKEGIITLLKKFATKTVFKEVLKYFPGLGQAASAFIGYKITKTAGESYLEDCYKAAKEFYEKELRKI